MSIIELTESAQDKINSLCKENKSYAVTLDMKGGGCAGFEYTWGFCEQEDIDDRDEIIDAGEGKLVVGAHSIMFLIGTTIDYKNEIFGSHFDIINPNAQSSCGCGTSVSFNMEDLDVGHPA